MDKVLLVQELMDNAGKVYIMITHPSDLYINICQCQFQYCPVRLAYSYTVLTVGTKSHELYPCFPLPAKLQDVYFTNLKHSTVHASAVYLFRIGFQVHVSKCYVFDNNE